MYTAKQVEELKNLGAIAHFRTVVNAQYLRNVPTNLTKEVERIYKEASDDKTSFNLACRSCVYDLYNRAGKLYFQYVEDLSKRLSKGKKTKEEAPKAEEITEKTEN